MFGTPTAQRAVYGTPSTQNGSRQPVYGIPHAAAPIYGMTPDGKLTSRPLAQTIPTPRYGGGAMPPHPSRSPRSPRSTPQAPQSLQSPRSPQSPPPSILSSKKKGMVQSPGVRFNLDPAPSDRREVLDRRDKQRGQRPRHNRTPEEKRERASRKAARAASRLASAHWFLSGVPKSEVQQLARSLAAKGRLGNFLVRDVASRPDCLGLVVKTTRGISNYLIERTENVRHIGGQGFRMRGGKQTFPTLVDLLQYYCDMPRPPFPFQLVPINDRGSLDNGVAPVSPTVMSLGSLSKGKPKSPTYATTEKTMKMGERHQRRHKSQQDWETVSRTSMAPPTSEKHNRKQKLRKSDESKSSQHSPEKINAPTPHEKYTDALPLNSKDNNVDSSVETFTVILGTTPSSSNATKSAAILLNGTEGRLRLVLGKAEASTPTGPNGLQYFRFVNPTFGSLGALVSIRCAISHRGGAVTIDSLHISSSSGLQCQALQSYVFGKDEPQVQQLDVSILQQPQKHITLVGSGNSLISPARDPSIEADVNDLLSMRVEGPGMDVYKAAKLKVREPSSRRVEATGTATPSRDTVGNEINSSWLAELSREEIRIFQAIDKTEADIETLRHEDVTGVIVAGEISKRVKDIESSRDSLANALEMKKKDIDNLEASKNEGENEVQAAEEQLMKLHEQHDVSLAAKDVAQQQYHRIDTEYKAAEAHVVDLESRRMALGLDEATTKSMLVETEDLLEKLLLEEQALRSQEQTREMAAANAVASQQLQDIEVSRALRELAAQKLDQESESRRAQELLQRSHIQEILEADLVGIDDVLSDPSVNLNDETKLAAAESQVRMLEEKLVLAEAHLKFAETTANLAKDFPNSEQALLEELSMYEASLGLMGGHFDDGSDVALSDFEDSSNVLNISQSIQTNPKNQFRDLFNLLKQHSDSLTVETAHLREVLASTGASMSALNEFDRAHNDPYQVIDEETFVNILSSYQNILPGLQKAEQPKNNPIKSDAEPSAADNNEDDESDSDRDDEFGFPDQFEEVEPEGGSGSHVERLMRVWQLRETHKAPARRLSEEVRNELINKGNAVTISDF